MSAKGKLFLTGIAFGGLAWFVWKGAQASTVAPDTANGEAQTWAAGADSLLTVAYNVTGSFMSNNMEISLAGLALIKKVEGYSDTVYKDTAGYRTIGYGHKLTALESYSTITEAEASRLLAKDVTSAESTVNSAVTVPLDQSQFDALVSFVFNVGGGAFRRSTLLKKINANEPLKSITDEFGRWIYAGGQPSEGLANRRTLEIAAFTGRTTYL